MTQNRDTNPSLKHLAVMPVEVLEILEPRPGKRIVDATLGGAGHSKLLLQAGASVIGIDQDTEALGRVQALGLLGLECKLGNFRDMDKLLGGEQVDGVLMDLGVSSFQLDDPTRGFSYHHEAALDMRMGQDGDGAFELINDWDSDEIARVLFAYGEERHSRRIARAIVEARTQKPIATTTELAEIIKRAYPGGHARGIHPARRSFQAIRIAVNDELGALREGLAAALKVLKPGGRLAVIAFHSLEDRIVKHFMRDNKGLQALTKRPLEPSQAESASNPRARSAKLRGAEKISTFGGQP